MNSARHCSAFLLATAVAVCGCDLLHKETTSSNVLAPTAAVPSLVGTWASPASVASPAAAGGTATCTNFVWAITSQTATDVAGTFSAVCLGNANITGNGSGHISGSTVNIAISGNGSMPGLPSCPFSISGTGTIDGEVIRVPYSGTTCLGPVSGTQTLQRSLIQPAPAPAPAAPAPTPAPPPPPTPAPPPAPTPGPGDVLVGATVLNSPAGLPNWPVTTTITDLELRPNGIHLEFSKQNGPGRWPDVFPPGWDESLQYTLGMCLNISAHWYLLRRRAVLVRPGRFRRSTGELRGQLVLRSAPLGPDERTPAGAWRNHRLLCLRRGLSNNTTGSGSTVKERSNVVLVPMPGPGGASFRF